LELKLTVQPLLRSLLDSEKNSTVLVEQTVSLR
jgi:hypothetical protein